MNANRARMLPLVVFATLVAILAPTAQAQTPPTFSVYPAPNGLGTNSGEPSIGVNWNSDRVMFIAGLETLRVEYDECTSPPVDTWTDVSADNTSITTLDPILFVDHITGRTFASQLAAKCSNMSYSDDDGDNWMLSQGCGINAGVDHQTVGGGPYNSAAIPPPPPPQPPDNYPHAVYYCSQDAVAAQCARSDNGGLTFGPAVPMYNVGDCAGLHGAIHVDVDGTVYVPNKNCNAIPLMTGGNNAVVVSDDNGLTWSIRDIHVNDANGTGGNWDPSVWAASQPGSGANGTGTGTLYAGFLRTQNNLDRLIWAGVSNDNGQTWSNRQNIGLGAGPGGQDLRNAAFPVAVAGDGDRAAIGFLGAIQGGDGAGDSPSTGHEWHAYVAVTYDGGQTWVTTNVTPGDPVQRGQVCDNGPNCAAARNLLDFNDMALDAVGRVVFGFADGCIGDCVTGTTNSASELATIVRQVGGRRLLSAFDNLAAPGSPRLFAALDDGDSSIVHVSWQEPDDHGSPILGYQLYKRLDTEMTSTALMSFGAGDRTFTDSIDPLGPKVWYSIEATNAAGTSVICREVSPTGDESPCIPPGLTILEDAVGDQTLAGPDARPEYDIEKLSINERPDLGAGMIEFVLKMVSMADPLPNSTYPIAYRSGNVDRFVRLHLDATGSAFFTYGTGTDVSPTTAPGTPADPASTFTPEGEIRIVVDRADIGNPAIGSDLTSFLVRVRREAVAVSPTPDNMPSSLTPGGSYTIFGSENCQLGDPPIAVLDEVSTLEDAPIVINVIANDISFNGPLEVISVSTPDNGSVVNNGDGTVTYVPDPGFTSPPVDTFTYVIEDRAELTDVGMVMVTVESDTTLPHCSLPGIQVVGDPLGDTNAVIDATDDPSLDIEAVYLAEPDFGFGEEKLVATLKLEDFSLPHPSAAWRIFWTSPGQGPATQSFVSLENCNAAAGIQCSYGTYDGTLFSSAGAPEGCEFSADGTITITVDKSLVNISDGSHANSDLTNVNGVTQVFFGAACTGLLGQADLAGPGTYEIQTNESCRNTVVARDDFDVTDENTPVTIDVLANDDGDGISVTNVGAAANGTVVNNGTDVTYTPNNGFDGNDSFLYTISDGVNTDDATVFVTVNDTVNSPPTADDQAVSTNEDTSVAITLTATDPEGAPLTYTVVDGPANGSLAGTAPNLTYTPNADYNGPDSFTFRANDGVSDSNLATVSITVNPVNDPPIAFDDDYSTQEDTTLTVAPPGVLANDQDIDDASLSAVLASPPANGGLVLNPDGSFSYTPDMGFCDDTDTFTYRADDGDATSNPATVSILVTCANTNARPIADDQMVATNEDTSLPITLTATDPDGDPLTFAVTSGPSHGALSGTAPNLTYTPNANYNGPDSFTFDACDAELCDEGVVSISVLAVNDAPVAADDAYSTTEQATLTVPAPGVLANDVDVDGNALASFLESGPLNGSLTLQSNGSFSYTPDAGFCDADDTFTYRASDGAAQSNAATVTISVSCDVVVEPCDFCQAGKPSELTLTYVGGDCSASDNTQGDKADCSDFGAPPPADQDVYLVATDDDKHPDDSDSDREWFRGWVSPDEAFTLMAAAEDKDDFGSKLFVHVFDGEGGALLQLVEIHTSCSAPLIEGERFGSVVTGDTGNPGECPALPEDGQGRVHGSGFLRGLMGIDGDADSDSDSDSDSDADSDSEKVDFSFDAKFKHGLLKGKLKLRDKELDVKISSKTITSLSPGGGLCNGVATSAEGGFELTAVGEFNGAAGAEFRVCGEDNGSPGKGDGSHPADRFYLECLMGCSYDTASRTVDDGIDGGNIHLHEAIVAPGSGGAPVSADIDPAAEVVDLDPMLIDSLVVGTEQLLTAVVWAADESLAVNRALTLHWETAAGQVGAVGHVTDGLGVAVFVVPVQLGDLRYWVELDSSGVESNGVDLIGFP